MQKWDQHGFWIALSLWQFNCASCSRGDACGLCHNRLELLYHDSSSIQSDSDTHNPLNGLRAFVCPFVPSPSLLGCLLECLLGAFAVSLSGILRIVSSSGASVQPSQRQEEAKESFRVGRSLTCWTQLRVNSEVSACQRGDLCAFAHHREEVACVCSFLRCVLPLCRFLFLFVG